MLELEYVNVNEEGEEYDVHDNFAAALVVLNSYPNDTMIVRYKSEKSEQFSDADARDLMDELDEMLDRFDEVLNTAEISGYRAVQHKLEEAMGPLRGAREAAEQYSDGTLRIREEKGGD